MVSTCVPDKSIEFKLVHFQKALEPMVVSELGIMIEVKLVQISKAFEPMVVTCVPDKSIEVKPEHPAKAYSPMPVTVYPSTVEGIVIAPLKSVPLVVALPLAHATPVPIVALPPLSV